MTEKSATKISLELTSVRGYPVAKPPIGSPDFTEAAMDYKAKDGDVVLFGYAKSGSHWLLNIMWVILHKGEHYRGIKEMNFLVPWIERAGTEAADVLPEPRFFRHHLPYNLITKTDRAKYVFIHRKPEDVIVSYYHFTKEFSEDPHLDFNKFFEAFMDGNIWFGDYFDHLLAAYAHKNDDNFLMVSYELLKSDTRDQVLRLAKFLGEEYHKMLVEDNEAMLKKVIEITSFDYMKKNLKFTLYEKDRENKAINFFRKGVVGEGKKTLSGDQMKKLRERIEERMKGTEFVDIWLS